MSTSAETNDDNHVKRSSKASRLSVSLGLSNIFSPTARPHSELNFDPDWELELTKCSSSSSSGDGNNEKSKSALSRELKVAASEFVNGRKSSAFLRYTYEKYPQLWINPDSNIELYEAMLAQGEHIIEREFYSKQSRNVVPTMQELIDVILCRYRYNEENHDWFVKYKEGDWVEVMDVDMQWRLNRVKEIKVQDVDGDGDAGDEEWEVTYDVGGLKDLSSEDIRCSEAGLKMLFGIRPWVWQQYALLKVEERIRFQRDHADDFVNFPIIDTAKELWETWLENPDNSDFKELYNHPGIGESGRRMLISHILKPFELMSMLAEGQEGWDVANEDVLGEFGAFTYLSFIGDGFFFPFTILLLQIAIPALIIIGNMMSYLWKWERDFDDIIKDPGWFFETARCVYSPLIDTESLQIASLMALVIQCLYFVQVTPDTIMNFYLQVGNAGKDIFQKMKSLRMRIRDKKHDRVGQNIGYTMDLVMNTFYVCFLYMANIFNVIQTDDTFEMLLNCLALIFVAEIDEDFCKSPWWDPGHRWIKAASVELVLQYYVDKPALKKLDLFALKYSMNPEVLLEICNRDKGLLRNGKVARTDCRDMSLMNESERIRFMSSELALLTGNQGAIAQYCKEQQYFGKAEYDYILKPFYSLLTFFNPKVKLTGGVFNRYEKYRTWSRWHDILYIGVLPDIDLLLTKKNLGGKIEDDPDSIDTDTITDEWNYDPEFRSSYGYFWTVTFFETLFLKELIKKTLVSISEGRVMDVLFWIYDAAFEWISFVFHIIFPIYCLWGIVLWPKCFNDIPDGQDESSFSSGY